MLDSLSFDSLGWSVQKIQVLSCWCSGHQLLNHRWLLRCTLSLQRILPLHFRCLHSLSLQIHLLGFKTTLRCLILLHQKFVFRSLLRLYFDPLVLQEPPHDFSLFCWPVSVFLEVEQGRFTLGMKHWW